MSFACLLEMRFPWMGCSHVHNVASLHGWLREPVPEPASKAKSTNESSCPNPSKGTAWSLDGMYIQGHLGRDHNRHLRASKVPENDVY